MPAVADDDLSNMEKKFMGGPPKNGRRGITDSPYCNFSSLTGGQIGVQQLYKWDCLLSLITPLTLCKHDHKLISLVCIALTPMGVYVVCLLYVTPMKIRN